MYNEHSALVKRIAEKLEIDPRIVDYVVKQLLSNVAGKIRNYEDMQAMMFPYLGKIAFIEGRKKKE
jgi:nucleoid DNA-binding protein